jgi:hypothetical protein
MGGTSKSHGRDKKLKMSFQKTEEKRLLERSRCRRKYDIRYILNE